MAVIKCTVLLRNDDVLGMVGESDCQVFDVFCRERLCCYFNSGFQSSYCGTMNLFKAFSQRCGECCRTEGKMEALELARGAAEGYPATGQLWRRGGMDEDSGTWVRCTRWGTFTAGVLVSKRERL